jgi:hypothetical protein
MTTSVTRKDLAELKGITPKLVRFFEDLFSDTFAAAEATAGTVEATSSIQNATVLTLSSNAAFNNERVVTFSADFTVNDGGPGNPLSISLAAISINAFTLRFNLLANTVLNLPTSGTLAALDLGPSYATDAAAAAGGVAVGEIYKGPLGAVVWRQV